MYILIVVVNFSKFILRYIVILSLFLFSLTTINIQRKYIFMDSNLFIRSNDAYAVGSL